MYSVFLFSGLGLCVYRLASKYAVSSATGNLSPGYGVASRDGLRDVFLYVIDFIQIGIC